MENFKEANNQFKSFRDNFKSVVKDKFGANIDNEYFNKITSNLSILSNYEDKQKVQVININKILLEAQAKIPDMMGY